MHLDGLGSFRMIAGPARHAPVTVVVGLPTAAVDDTLMWV